jgi:ACS family hexuronate transporter-like MFS transporter
MGRLRWHIGALLFASTVINYLDRQTLSVLAPRLKVEFTWSNTDFAFLVIAFRIAYAIGQPASGWVLDRLGTRAGLSLAVAFYSTTAMVTSFANSFASFWIFRFLLGLGESANWPGATKAVSEWFPRRESGWAVALFDSGSSIGAAIAPLLVLWLLNVFGSWRPSFFVIGSLGFAWLIVFRRVYQAPDRHPRISPEELAYIRAGNVDQGATADERGYRGLLALPSTWGIIVGKTLTDPVWFFITDWFAIYLASRGFRLEDTLIAFWVPFVAADAGNFLGGGISSYLIRRGWRAPAARKAVIVAGAIGMSVLMLSLVLDTLAALSLCFAVSTLSYAALSTMILNLPADLYPSRSVASVSGMSGAGAGLGTIAATFLTGVVADRHSFAPILVGASVVPLLGAAIVCILIRDRGASAMRTI